MNGISKGLAVVAIAATAAIGATTAAQSQTAPDQTTRIAPVQVVSDSVRVAYGDLDLDTTRGMETIQARIHRASFMVCQVNRQPLIQQMERLECVNDARRGAFAQLAENRSRSYAQADRVLVLAFAQ